MITRYAIRIISGPHAGKYIKNYDAHFQPNPLKPQEYSGLVEVTSKKEDARTFENAMAAFLFWNQQSNTFPWRADGRPNKPLAAYTMQIVEVKF